jgi:serine/threonine-protein kinase
MAPEQFTGGSQNVDRGADVFAAGVVLWELLAGRRLFRGRDLAETMTQVLGAEIPALREVRDDVPEALEAVLAKALERDRDERYPTAREFEQAIDDAAGRVASARAVGEWVQRLAAEILSEREATVKRIESEVERPSSPSQAPPAEAPTTAEPAAPLREAPSRVRRGPGSVVVLLLAAAALAAVAIAIAGGRDEPGPQVAAPELATSAPPATVATAIASAAAGPETGPEPPPAASNEPSSTASPAGRTRPRASASSRGYYPPRP